MRILVTGATGFIGRHLLKELLLTGNDVTITTSDINKTGKDTFFNKFSIKKLDLNNIDISKNYFQEMNQPDLLIHIAWQGLPNYLKLFHYERNLFQHYAFLKNLIENGLKDLVVSGTCLEYGFKEGCLSEDMISDPQNPYALAKDSLRKFLEQLKMSHSFHLKWVRLFYIFGEGQNPNSLLPQLEKAISQKEKVFNMSEGEQIRDYLPVESVATYILKISLQNKITGIINCCSGKPIKIKDLVKKYLKERNYKLQLNKGFYSYTNYEPMSFWGDNSKLKKILNNEESITGI
jgi:dTDP-6-deoxy-L-talose 4-dehydrogenase (NAD+)